VRGSAEDEVHPIAISSGPAQISSGWVWLHSRTSPAPLQNLTEFTQYLEAIQRGDLPISRAMATTEEERMIREFILQMKLGRISGVVFPGEVWSQCGERFSPAVR
jgi:oxygen-independent coproporphyrinogen-3 oxidase